MEYVPIESIDELDPLKISIRDINKRYIDREGNRFATRFNLHTRKVEIVRIVKGRAEALRVRDEVRRSSRDEVVVGRPAKRQPDAVAVEETETEAGEDSLSLESRSSYEGLGNEASFDEAKFVEETVHDVEKIRERVLGILNNVKRSTIFEHKKDASFSQVEREADSEVITRLEKTLNNHKELYQYPRSISYYASRLSHEHKEKLDALQSDEEKLMWIRRWETQEDFVATYNKVEEFATRLKIVLDGIPESEVTILPATMVQGFRDAKSSTTFLIQNAVERLSHVNAWSGRYP